MQITFFNDIFDKWVTLSPDGRPFVDPPWETSRQAFSRPFYLYPYKTPTKIIFIATMCLTLGAFITTARIVFPICSGLLALMYYALKESWLLSSALHIEPIFPAQKVGEKQPFELRLKVFNRGSFGALDGRLYFEFLGSTKHKHVLTFPAIFEGDSFEIRIEMVADAGMGRFELQDVFLVTSDCFGFFTRCVKHQISFQLEVSPEIVPMPPLKLNIAGRSAHDGTIEAKTSGDSTTFLGVRDFRAGDSIRRIDWKRSARHLSLIVRDFEKLNSTDATFFIDNRSLGVFEFNGLNSFEHLKDAVISLAHRLIEQGVRVQIFLQDGRTLAFGSGPGFLEDLVELIRDLRPDGGGSFIDFLQRNKEFVPADSLVLPVFGAVDIDTAILREVFYSWNAIRCEVIPIIIDIPKFERQVVRNMEYFAEQKMDLAFFRQLYMGSSDEKIYENISRKIYENSILIGPGEQVGEVYARMHPWQV